MAKRRYRVKAGYLAMGNRNIYQGNEVELDPSNPGTATLLEMEAIEEIKVKKEKADDADNGRD